MAPRTYINKRNQAQGASFENTFEFSARIFGLLPIRNGLKVRHLPGGGLQKLRSNLDYTLLAHGGVAAFLDTKSFQGDGFTYSQLEAHQLHTALQYELRGFVAGFVVHLRKTNNVSFYAAGMLQKAGPRSRFTPEQGVSLGTVMSFDLRRIWPDKK